MISTYEIETLANMTWREQVNERRRGREIRIEEARQQAKRRLQREVERMLKASGSVQPVLDVLSHVAHETGGSNPYPAGRSCY